MEKLLTDHEQTSMSVYRVVNRYSAFIAVALFVFLSACNTGTKQGDEGQNAGTEQEEQQ